MSNTVSRLAHFGRHLATVDPGLATLADLDRRCHIEPDLTVVTTETRPRDCGCSAPCTGPSRTCGM